MILLTIIYLHPLSILSILYIIQYDNKNNITKNCNESCYLNPNCFRLQHNTLHAMYLHIKVMWSCKILYSYIDGICTSVRFIFKTKYTGTTDKTIIND